ncbi:neural cell adhesion molecule 1-like isoform X7 [Polyodon spathula]|uniref:neural cell adhesion molecule 1-like isoform X7 n=1 Tax=Polyodon spathula TaxID=7913 RepID=UPI001B7E8E3C|nr:neural cell adhesion molecule 1-like isoform X7 [Polyodon spathula]
MQNCARGLIGESSSQQELTASLQVDIVPAQGEISVGESKFFLCTVTGEADLITWFSPSGDKIETGQRISVVRNDEQSSTLTVYSADIDDAGTYKCVATFDGNESQATVNMKIFQKLTFRNAPSPQEYNEGDDAVIICDVTSSPPPNVIWKHRSREIFHKKDVRFSILSNNYLQIRGIKKTDEGTYRCEGRILARGEISFKDIQIIVNVPPTIRARHTELNATSDIGQSATLICDADGFPEPAVSWARVKNVLEESDKYSFTEDGSQMTILNVKKEDQGEYTCIAKNKAGETEQEISLNVFVKPKITYVENKTALELEEQITLTCEAIGDPTPSIVWSSASRIFTEGEQYTSNRIYQASWTRPEKYESLDGNVVVRSDGRVSSLTLKDIQYTDAGQYVCTARSSIGQDSQSMFLEVHYAPKLQGSVTVYTWEGNPANITCEVFAHPGASVVWFRDGQQLPNANTTNVKIYPTPSASFLEITPDSQSDFGNYNCTATNRIGQESKEFILIQAEVPSSPLINEVSPYSSTARVEFEEPDSSGGVPVLKYKAEWRVVGASEWMRKEFDARDVYAENLITITGLRPDSRYELRMSAINGKGQGESSESTIFKTEPVQGEPSPPKLEGKAYESGNTLKVNWIKQDDGGSPIRHYLVRYRAKQMDDWKPEIRLPADSEYAILGGLEWNTEYEVYVVAENQQGKSKPSTLFFRTVPEPTSIPDETASGSGLSTGAIVGILIVVFIILLVVVDVTCYFLNKCGLIMCMAVNFCGKPGPGAKGKDMEEGKAAFSKDESKEPIVEVRTEDEHTPNHDGGNLTEPNETTPLTEPEHPADTTATVEDMLPSVATNSDTITETFATAQNSPSSETTTLTSSTTAPAPAPVQQASTPKAGVHSPTSPAAASTEAASKVAPLVDLSDAPAANSPAAPSPNPINAPKAPSATKTQAPAAPPAAVSTPTPTAEPPKPKTDAVKSPENEAPQPNGVKSPAEAAKNPTSPKTPSAPDSNAKPSQNEDIRVDLDLAKDVFAVWGSDPPPAANQAAVLAPAAADSTKPSTPAKDEKVPVEEKTKPEEAEIKQPVAEVKTVPNEASQTNSNESKA